MHYSPSDHLALMKEGFPMTVKGVCLTCLGDVFEDEEEPDRLSSAFHACWGEMEVCVLCWGEMEVCVLCWGEIEVCVLYKRRITVSSCLVKI